MRESYGKGAVVRRLWRRGYGEGAMVRGLW